MKNIFKAAGYMLATVITLVLFCFSAFAAGDSESGPLNTSQIISGIVLLATAILIPALKRAHKSATNK